MTDDTAAVQAAIDAQAEDSRRRDAHRPVDPATTLCAACGKPRIPEARLGLCARCFARSYRP